MVDAKGRSLSDEFGGMCDNFSSVLKTIHLFDEFIDAGGLNIPPEKVDEVRNSVKAPLAIMLAYMQSSIEELLDEINKKTNS